MKTSIIFFRAVGQNFDGEYYQKIISTFTNGGCSASDVAILSASDEMAFVTKFISARDTFDNLIIVDNPKCEFDVKQIIADKMETMLLDNENAKTFADAVCKARGIAFNPSYALLPVEATVMPNVTGAFQGFILDSSDMTLAVLPEKYSELKIMSEKYLLPYLKNKSGNTDRRLTLKYFGSLEKAEEVLKSAKGQNEGICYDISCRYGDITISIVFDNLVTNEDRINFNRQVVGQLKDDIYAEFDTTLAERVFDLLKLKNIKISVAESFTGGLIASSIIKNPGASDYVFEGIVSYSEQSKIKRLGVDPNVIRTEGAVSSAVAYQMTAGLLKGGKCQLAIATTGIAGPNSDRSNKPVGLGYIAVGMADGVHTYRYNFSGNRDEIMETAKNTALFLSIKKLKNI